jgi:hypothetical protein
MFSPFVPLIFYLLFHQHVQSVPPNSALSSPSKMCSIINSNNCTLPITESQCTQEKHILLQRNDSRVIQNVHSLLDSISDSEKTILESKITSYAHLILKRPASATFSKNLKPLDNALQIHGDDDSIYSLSLNDIIKIKVNSSSIHTIFPTSRTSGFINGTLHEFSV